jgi:prevent-host-death family protein
MEKVTISELKNQLSAFLKKVRAGESVLILDRNKPVARLESVEQGGLIDDRLARLESEGLLRRPAQQFPKKLLDEPPPEVRESVLDALIEERRAGR